MAGLPPAQKTGAFPNATANGDASNGGNNRSVSPIWLIPSGRTIATEAFGPLWLAPPDARIVAVGRHGFLPMSAVAWISEQNEIIVAIEGHSAEAGRSVLVSVWTRESWNLTRSAVFQVQGARAVAISAMGPWDGFPVAGLTLLSLIEPGEEW